MLRRKLIYSGICLLATVLMSGSVSLGQKGGGSDSTTVVAAQVIKVERSSQQTFIGTIQPVRKALVGTAVAGRVIEALVEAGDPVKYNQGAEVDPDMAGQPMFGLRTGTLDIELGAAKIQLQIAEQGLEELLTKMPTELELAQAKAEETAAMYSNAEAEFQRIEKMQDSVSTLELEQAKLKFQINRQLSTAASISLKQLKATEQIRISQAKSQVAAARQELTRLQDLREKYTIRAPFDGFVTKKLAEVGDWATAGQALVEVVQLDPIEIVINVPQSYIHRLQQSLGAGANTVQLEVDGIDQPFAGKIQRIVPQADLKLRSFPVKIRVANQKIGDSYVLQPGMIGRVGLAIGNEVEMLMVKKDALVLGTADPSIWVLKKKGPSTTVSQVTVKTGSMLGEWIQVIGDISENDTIVLQGNERLRAGQAVTVTRTETESIPKS
ncbi:MAG: efflux RND transporter periplasmic adaptor subunit [Planctomycetota bacterium]|nr:efflux RND transporter periplasmic adaptor subunit [Planctomycetota bacterium]